jgi:hypothetical protein
MSLMAQTTEWLAYMGATLAAAEVDESSAADAVDKHKALSAVLNADAKTVTAAKAQAWTDDEFVAAKARLSEAYAYRKMLGALYEATDRKAVLLSREVTRRVGREPREQRVGRYSA